ncbi:uncharacterized protein LOC135111287 [Scylla paramamosain]|uniref:uncharacterized protein LOC135111287 n=1 Tax=Scylla paramamosain TaxID=85552 RepID=UPI0030839107
MLTHQTPLSLSFAPEYQGDTQGFHFDPPTVAVWGKGLSRRSRYRIVILNGDAAPCVIGCEGFGSPATVSPRRRSGSLGPVGFLTLVAVAGISEVCSPEDGMRGKEGERDSESKRYAYRRTVEIAQTGVRNRHCPHTCALCYTCERLPSSPLHLRAPEIIDQVAFGNATHGSQSGILQFYGLRHRDECGRRDEGRTIGRGGGEGKGSKTPGSLLCWSRVNSTQCFCRQSVTRPSKHSAAARCVCEGVKYFLPRQDAGRGVTRPSKHLRYITHGCISQEVVHAAYTNTDETRPPVSMIPRGWRCRASV